MKIRYRINDAEVSKDEFWRSYFKQMGVEDLILTLPEDKVFAMEYGEPLPKGDKTFKLIHKSLKKECSLTGDDLEKKARQQYELFTEKHVPYPFIESLMETLEDMDTEDLQRGQFKIMILKGVRARLKEYNMQGICTLGLEEDIKIHTKAEDGYGKDEHEAV